MLPGSRESAGSIGEGIARVGVPPDGPGADVAASGRFAQGSWPLERGRRDPPVAWSTFTKRSRPSFAEDPEHRRNLVVSYMELARLLCEIGRQTEAAEPYRKALELEEDDPP